METKIKKWGNSLAVRLPKNIIKEGSLKEGSDVLIAASKKGITIRKVTRKKKSFKEKLSQVTPENVHSVNEWGTALGKEIW